MISTIHALLMLAIIVFDGVISNGERPAVVNIGAVLTYESAIGRVAKAAIEAAVQDVNASKKILNHTRLNLIMEDSNCSAFIGAVAALKVLDKDVITIIGPQSSTIAHMLSYISNGFRIPLVSFAATDPSLSSLQYPYFIRMTQSDSYQMAAMADLIEYHRWKLVIAVFVDDDYGRNGIYALDDELNNRRLKISYKIVLPIGASRNKISELLENSKSFGPRVYVVHASPDSGLKIFHAAHELQMLADEFIWFATDWLTTTLDTFELSKTYSLNYLQGVVGLRQYIPPSRQKKAFKPEWNKLNAGVPSSKMNAYGFYAYDTVWAVAHAINDFLDNSGNITFTSSDQISDNRGQMRINMMKTFDGGELLRQKLLHQNFSGLSGPIRFDGDRNLISGNYEIINIYGSVMNTVGYWTNLTHLSLSFPDASQTNGQRNLSSSKVLGNITWPGGKTMAPRGWIPSTHARPLRIGVPRRLSFVQFVNISMDNRTLQGYCIDVFREVLKQLPYEVPYQFVPFGDGRSTPIYWSLVNMVADNEIDALVGDFSIVLNRTKLVDFTQPYISTALVVVVPTKSTKSSAWVFLRPFTVGMWCVTGAFFFLIGIVIWMLEHRVNKDFRGSPKQQCLTMFLFSFSTLFHSEQEETLSTLGRFVMMLPSSIKGIDSLIATNDPIGYQEGSFALGYMANSLKIPRSRLISYRTPDDYAEALWRGPKNGGVAAIVDELPYIEIFLETRSGFGIVGQPFTRSGWGFAFRRNSPLAVDLSSAILKLAENGDLQKIHNKWFCRKNCDHRADSSKPNQLHLSSFWGLFMICGIVAIAALLVFFLQSIRQFIHFKKQNRDNSSITSCSKTIYSFFDFIDEKEEAVKKLFKQQQCSSQPEVS
ncbi:glutamate receptor 3.7-like isoform X2 [Phalaenopsis equestris]|uniref:glutamate receptor 3.7-like isoform X2 n=1 Tax=Phalaenopsis equestris TaxID=78828 RepID=UPI0009E295A0|nr:glutamate receptor 3.7-like isoform X2 [Phalaenopsis equestris]